MKNITILTLSLLFIFSSCGEKKAKKQDWQDIEKELTEQFIMAKAGDTIFIPEGYYQFSGSLWMDEKKNVVIKGAGMDKTVLNFKKQTEGAEGIKITNSDNITIIDLTVQDTKGDCIKTQKVNRLTVRNVKTEWTGEPSEENGSYGLYPVDCDTVLIDNCTAIGASDAGIYVGQSRDIIVKNCYAHQNVAGIEIENCIRADVYNNHAFDNTGGILIFDMPELTQSGSHVRIFDNKVEKNNYRNFAPEGNIVGEVPPGTGIMVLATKFVEIFDNEVIKNKTIGCAITSYKLVRKPYDDPDFNPFPKGIYVHNNTFTKGTLDTPALNYDLGKLMMAKFPISRPDIVFDGFMDPEIELEGGNYVEPYKICVRDNKDAKFAYLDAPNDFENVTTELKGFDCSRVELDDVEL